MGGSDSSTNGKLWPQKVNGSFTLLSLSFSPSLFLSSFHSILCYTWEPTWICPESIQTADWLTWSNGRALINVDAFLTALLLHEATKPAGRSFRFWKTALYTRRGEKKHRQTLSERAEQKARKLQMTLLTAKHIHSKKMMTKCIFVASWGFFFSPLTISIDSHFQFKYKS